MQSIHHVVMTALKRSIDPGRLQYHQFERSFQVIPTHPVREGHEIIKTRRCTRRNAVKAHRKRASGEAVSAQIPCDLKVEVADRLVLVRVFRNPEDRVDPRSRVRTITQIYGG